MLTLNHHYSSLAQRYALDIVGLVGNSGNTSEPHLHVHAVRGRVTDLEALLWTGRGVPMTLDARFLIRNDRVEQCAYSFTHCDSLR